MALLKLKTVNKWSQFDIWIFSSFKYSEKLH